MRTAVVSLCVCERERERERRHVFVRERERSNQAAYGGAVTRCVVTVTAWVRLLPQPAISFTVRVSLIQPVFHCFPYNHHSLVLSFTRFLIKTTFLQTRRILKKTVFSRQEGFSENQYSDNCCSQKTSDPNSTSEPLTLLRTSIIQPYRCRGKSAKVSSVQFTTGAH